MAGDIYISIEQVKENAAQHHTACLTEVWRVMVHGVLHLSGYEDTPDTKERELMKEKENLYTQTLLPFDNVSRETFL